MTKLFTLVALLFLPIGFARAQTTKWAPMRYIESGFSNRSLLSNANSYNNSQSKASWHTTSSIDTINILAIRVEFQEDTVAITTGNGKFDLSTSSRDAIDPPPHDLDYFNNHLLALSNYYHTVSGGKLILRGEIFPKSPTGSYTLAHTMDYYNPNTTEEELYRRLSQLLSDAFTIADSSDYIDFHRFDSFIVFHAGVGNDLSLDYDPSPNDIPSVFLDFRTLKENLALDDPYFEGIAVGENFFIKEGMILPETESQEGYEIALNGTMAIMFGYQLGLPNLFNSDNGRPGIGRWGLMDQGSGNFSGLLPAQPCAWAKVFLGWEKPITVTNGYGLKVAAANTAREGKIYKIPINSKEYFLIENRQRDINRDGIAIGRDSKGNRIEFREDGTIAATGSSIGVITEVDEYDFGLPGSGILIWHIDESIIENKYGENRVNSDPDLKGVDLEEADGSQDIGQYYGFFHPGGGSEYGVAEDAFYKDNEIHMKANHSAAVAFTPTTTPNSRSNSGADSHIFITNFSNIDTMMTFDLAFDYYQSGFPQRMGQQVGSNSLAFADLDGDGKNEMVLSSMGREISVYDSIGYIGYTGGKIYAWRSGGSKVIPNKDSTAVFAEPKRIPYPYLESGAIFSSPAIGDLDGNGDLEVVIGSVGVGDVGVGLDRVGGRGDGILYAWKVADADTNGRADPLFVFENENVIYCSPVIATLEHGGPGKQVVVGDEGGNLIAVSEQGREIWRKKLDAEPIRGLARYGLRTLDSLVAASLSGKIFLVDHRGETIWERDVEAEVSGSPAIGDLDHDGGLDIILITKDGRAFSFDRIGNLLYGFPARLGNPGISSSPALGDIDGDGYLEIIIAGGGEIFALNHNGTLVNNFPIEIAHHTDGAYSSPILGDIDGDKDVEIIVGTPENQIVAFHHTGEVVEGFPLSTGSSVSSTPSLLDLDGDGDVELAVGCDDGYLYVWDLPGEYDPQNIPWGSYLHDAQHSGLNPERRELKKPSGELMPPSLVYNYPNPTEGDFTTIRYTLNYPATVNIRIYDLAGELVDELTGTGFPETDNEVRWNLKDVESGVYLARVEARGAGKNSSAIIKIAVVK